MKESGLQEQCLKLLENWEGKGKPVIGVRTNAGKVQIVDWRIIKEVWYKSNGWASFFSLLKRKLRWIVLCPAGWPDLTACINGQLVGFELKTKTGIQKTEQKEMAERITAAGGRYVVIRDVKELNRFLKKQCGDVE